MQTIKILMTVVAMALVGVWTNSALAAEKTITGEGKCAKCAMKETKECQNAIQVTDGGKTVTYYLAANDVSKKFHSNICKESAKVTATGEVSKDGDKMILTVTKIELAK